MGIFFRLGDSELALALLCQIVAHGINQWDRRVGTGGIYIVLVFRGLNEGRELGCRGTFETVEVFISQGMGDLTGAIGAEVHKDHGVAIFYGHWCLAFSTDGGGMDKFVVFVAGIGIAEGGDCILWRCKSAMPAVTKL